MTAEYEGFALFLPEDMKTFFSAEICPDTFQGVDGKSSSTHKFQTAVLGGVPKSGEIISK